MVTNGKEHLNSEVDEFEQNVFIISAARSGSKLLRDVLSQHLQVAAVPYDVNYIWKLGCYDKSDELSNIQIPAHRIKLIRKHLAAQVYNKNEARTVFLEKTVSNSLRVEFVRKVYPDAKFIHLYRDGRDVSLSSLKCWNSSAVSSNNQSRRVLFKKIAKYPFLSCFPYIYNLIKRRLKQMVCGGDLPIWGPEYSDIRLDQLKYSDLQVCALQWKHSVNSSLRSFQSLNHGVDYIDICFEDLVSSPEQSVGKILSFLNLPVNEADISSMISGINPEFGYQWKRTADKKDIETIVSLVDIELKKLGYDV